MEHTWKMVRALSLRLPLVTVLTGLVYGAGVQYRIGYWHAIGLPLMSSDRPFAEMIYEGFFGYLFSFFRIIKPAYLIVGILGGALLFALVTDCRQRFERGFVEWLRRRAIARHLRGEYGSDRSPSAVDTASRLIDHADLVVGPSSSAILILCFAALVAMVPWLASGERGAEQGRAALKNAQARVRQLRDGLVDVSVVTLRTYPDDRIVRAIPLECEGNRCVAVTAEGPVSLPSDRFLQESIVKAEWPSACLSPEAWKRRG